MLVDGESEPNSNLKAIHLIGNLTKLLFSHFNGIAKEKDNVENYLEIFNQQLLNSFNQSE